ncbi:MAG: hypothetical protein ACXWLH_01840 [Candidatus Saccharimonadales bacterium]
MPAESFIVPVEVGIDRQITHDTQDNSTGDRTVQERVTFSAYNFQHQVDQVIDGPIDEVSTCVDVFASAAPEELCSRIDYSLLDQEINLEESNLAKIISRDKRYSLAAGTVGGILLGSGVACGVISGVEGATELAGISFFASFLGVIVIKFAHVVAKPSIVKNNTDFQEEVFNFKQKTNARLLFGIIRENRTSKQV